MNTKPKSETPSPRPNHPNLNEVRLDVPQTIPSLWDVSELLDGPAPSSNGSPARKNGATPPAAGKQTPAAPPGRPSKVISELPDSDFPGAFFRPY